MKHIVASINLYNNAIRHTREFSNMGDAIAHVRKMNDMLLSAYIKYVYIAEQATDTRPGGYEAERK